MGNRKGVKKVDFFSIQMKMKMKMKMKMLMYKHFTKQKVLPPKFEK